MVVQSFPPLQHARSDGLLAIGGDLEVETLCLAYRSGIFPWPLADGTLAWFSPPKRTLLFFNELHISKSLKRFIAQSRLAVTFNMATKQVIQSCAAATNRGEQNGTWITPGMISAYSTLADRGYCQSCEVWEGTRLVGGIYGVVLGSMFAGESMFHHSTNASKLALVSVVQRLSNLGVKWLDCQVDTPLLIAFGARSVPRRHFIELLNQATNAKQISLSAP